MNPVKYLGIDISSQPKNTAACMLTAADTGDISIGAAEYGCNDERLRALIVEANFIGIDAPFGWPEPFKELVNTGEINEWDEETSRKLRLRTTDLVAQEKTKIWPLSVSSSWLALPAMRTAGLLHKCEVKDKSGLSPVNGKYFFEIYPMASLILWEKYEKGYKDPENLGARKKIINRINASISGSSLQIPTSYSDSDHLVDALIAAFTTYAAANKKTILPDENQLELAKTEGWIHMPNCKLKELFRP